MAACSIRLVRLTDEQIRRAIDNRIEDDVDAVSELGSEQAIDEASENESDHTSECDDEDDDCVLANDSDSDSEMHSAEQTTTTEHTTFSGRDGTIWESTPDPRNRPMHAVNRNTLNKVNLARGQRIDTAEIAFDCIISRNVIDTIVKYTNVEATKTDNIWREVDAVEIRAFIGLLLTAGVERGSKRNLVEYFDCLRGQPIFRATIGLRRFRDIMRFIRFDDKETRTARRQRDKLAPIRDVFNIINNNLGRMYSPSEWLTVDEQLVPFRGRCGFKQYIPSKPDKYGMKLY